MAVVSPAGFWAEKNKEIFHNFCQKMYFGASWGYSPLCPSGYMHCILLTANLTLKFKIFCVLDMQRVEVSRK